MYKKQTKEDPDTYNNDVIISICKLTKGISIYGNFMLLFLVFYQFHLLFFQDKGFSILIILNILGVGFLKLNISKINTVILDLFN